ncbi:MAG TPA: acetate kinase [Saprospiraceae bacterium]|nr:acetate kinase [Saprospiraceae bacterium]
MKILVLNAGSSSIKYQLIQIPDNKVICQGLVERIGEEKGMIHYQTERHRINQESIIPDHTTGLNMVADFILDSQIGMLKSADEIEAVGHRVVHGGSYFVQTTLITEKVKKVIKDLFSLAPLHNPPNLAGIEVAEKVFPKAKQVAVFDTAFHQTIPEVAHRYAIPNHFYEKDHIRLYGFHGTSHQYVAKKAIEFLAKANTKIISIHLGNGCSMTAIQDGKSIDHSLGFGPMNGLIMGTRSGDIDQSVVLYLQRHLGYTPEEISTILQKKSGMLGLTGSNDLRDIEAASAKGNKMAQLALAMNAYRIKKYIGSYAAIMNGLDALIFTAGIGENSDVIRQLVCTDLDFLGISLDPDKNLVRSKSIRSIESTTSKVKILVIPTNEELEIAEQVFAAL